MKDAATFSTDLTATGPEGNSRLTAVNGTILVALLAVEGVTVLDVRGLITLHVYLGLLLAGPVLLKCVSTLYRFLRYYTGARAYVHKGPPHPVLRVLGPVVVLSSVAVLGTGIGLVYAGPPHRQPLLSLHQASFIIWFAATTIHVLGHALDAASTTWRELRDARYSPTGRGRRWRTLAIALSLIAGVGFATAILPSASAWTSHQYQQSDHQREDH
jgi:hypothetical protein